MLNDLQSTEAEEYLYKEVYKITYDIRKNRNPNHEETEGVHEIEDNIVSQACRRAINAGVPVRKAYRIIARARFDALLKLGKEGYRVYQECFLIIEVDQETKNYHYTAGHGDVSVPLSPNYDYVGGQLVEFGLLLHMYSSTMSILEEALFVATEMISEGEITF